jgi:putative hydrolase of the HAD superfamily
MTSKFRQLFPQAAAIIFDLGNVVLNVDYSLTQRAFEALGLTPFSEIYSQARQSGLFDRLETGHLTPAGFRNEIRALLPLRPPTDAQIDAAWNAMLQDLPRERLALLTELKKEYRTFLLSNTNAIHLLALSAYLQQTWGIGSLSAYFEATYYSSDIGLRKPDVESYAFVVARHRLSPSTTVFIDDLPQNIAGAARAGLLTYHLTAGETLIDLFSVL